MKPVIAIPSYKRPDAKIFKRLAHIPLDKYIYVRFEELGAYAHNEKYGFEVVTLSNVDNIGDTRKKLVSHLNRINVEYAFVFDDDISKVEELLYDPRKKVWKAKRLIKNPENSPSFELEALKSWYRAARKENLSLSAPLYRPFAWASKRENRVALRQCIQCVLIKVPDILFVGNYKSTYEVGAEDMAIQYELMANGFNVGAITDVEYDCPSVGAGEGGNNSAELLNLKERYEKYCRLFWENVSSNKELVKISKTAKTGIPSIKFIWKNWS